MNLMDLATPNGLFCDGDWIEKRIKIRKGRSVSFSLQILAVASSKTNDVKIIT